MDKLRKKLEDIKNSLPIAVKLGTIEVGAAKILSDAVDEALSLYDAEKLDVGSDRMYLIVSKETFMVHGLFDTEEKANRYIANSDTMKIVYLGEWTLKQLQHLSDCFMGFVRSNYLRSEWDKWFKEWNEDKDFPHIKSLPTDWNNISSEIKQFCDENNYTSKPLLTVMTFIIEYLNKKYESPKELSITELK